MTAPPAIPGERRQRLLELAIPLLSFGTTGAGILLWSQGLVFDPVFSFAGSIAGSCILAYLAWIRPRKDIVALATPLYALIFSRIPAEGEIWIPLQLAFAASITILLVRLKHRFGASAAPAGTGGSGLDRYAALVRALIPPDPALSADAAEVFCRFAEGEYGMAAELAAARGREAESGPLPLARAFAIVAEQAWHIADGGPDPVEFEEFPREARACLFRDPGDDADTAERYAAALDNALLLLWAVGAESPDAGRQERLFRCRPLAEKLAERKV